MAKKKTVKTQRTKPVVKTGNRKLSLPLRFAAVDLGSNSIKLRISEITEPGRHSMLYDERFPVRLGHETFITGKLSRKMIQLAVEAMKKIEKICREYSVDEYAAIATSATREAANGFDLAAAIAKHTGINIEIISGSEEARMVALGVLGDIPPARQDYLIIDIGGGSGEVIFTNDYNIIDAQSFPLGAVRLKELYVKSDLMTPKEFDILHDQIVATLKNKCKIRTIPQDTICFGCAGTIQTLVGINVNGKGDKAQNKTMSLARINGLISQMKRMTLTERVKQFKLDARRAEIILPGAMVLAELMRHLSIQEVQLSVNGLRDGLIHDFMETNGFKKEASFDRERAFSKSLFEIVDKYGTERDHVVHVCNLSLSIFDALQSLHKFGTREKNLLKGAAMLHDIGQYISYSKHHKHSHYLIMNSDIPGIPERDKLIIAAISRYHRRAIPNPSQPEFKILNPEERLIVRKLAGILRVADALDKEHQGLVTTVACETKKGKVIFQLNAVRHVPVEVWAAVHKAELFEQAFHCKAQFKEIG